VNQRLGEAVGRPAIWAVVPIKALCAAKSRLAPALNLGQRQAIVLAMLDHTLDVLRGCAGLRGIVVISADATLAEHELGPGVTFLEEPAPNSLNISLDRASSLLTSRGAQGMLVVPGDLPHLRRDSVDAMLSRATSPGVVIAPDRRGGGTNALLVMPPRVIPFRFGHDSFAQHLSAAACAGIDPLVYRSHDLAFDVDLPEDLIELPSDWVGGGS